MDRQFTQEVSDGSFTQTLVSHPSAASLPLSPEGDLLVGVTDTLSFIRQSSSKSLKKQPSAMLGGRPGTGGATRSKLEVPSAKGSRPSSTGNRLLRRTPQGTFSSLSGNETVCSAVALLNELKPKGGPTNTSQSSVISVATGQPRRAESGKSRDDNSPDWAPQARTSHRPPRASSANPTKSLTQMTLSDPNFAPLRVTEKFQLEAERRPASALASLAHPDPLQEPTLSIPRKAILRTEDSAIKRAATASYHRKRQGTGGNSNNTSDTDEERPPQGGVPLKHYSNGRGTSAPMGRKGGGVVLGTRSGEVGEPLSSNDEEEESSGLLSRSRSKSPLKRHNRSVFNQSARGDSPPVRDKRRVEDELEQLRGDSTDLEGESMQDRLTSAAKMRRSVGWLAYWGDVEAMRRVHTTLLDRIDADARTLVRLSEESQHNWGLFEAAVKNFKNLSDQLENERIEAGNSRNVEKGKVTDLKGDNDLLLAKASEMRKTVTLAETTTARFRSDAESAHRYAARVKHELENAKMVHAVEVVQLRHTANNMASRDEARDVRLLYLEDETTRQTDQIRTFQKMLEVVRAEKQNLQDKLTAFQTSGGGASAVIDRSRQNVDASSLQALTQKNFQRREKDLVEQTTALRQKNESLAVQLGNTKLFTESQSQGFEAEMLSHYDLDANTGMVYIPPKEKSKKQQGGKKDAGKKEKERERYVCGPIDCPNVPRLAVAQELEAKIRTSKLKDCIDLVKQLGALGNSTLLPAFSGVLQPLWAQASQTMPAHPKNSPDGEKEALHQSLQAHTDTFTQAATLTVTLADRILNMMLDHEASMTSAESTTAQKHSLELTVAQEKATKREAELTAALDKQTGLTHFQRDALDAMNSGIRKETKALLLALDLDRAPVPTNVRSIDKPKIPSSLSLVAASTPPTAEGKALSTAWTMISETFSSVMTTCAQVTTDRETRNVGQSVRQDNQSTQVRDLNSQIKELQAAVAEGELARAKEVTARERLAAELEAQELEQKRLNRELEAEKEIVQQKDSALMEQIEKRREDLKTLTAPPIIPPAPVEDKMLIEKSTQASLHGPEVEAVTTPKLSKAVQTSTPRPVSFRGSERVASFSNTLNSEEAVSEEENEALAGTQGSIVSAGAPPPAVATNSTKQTSSTVAPKSSAPSGLKTPQTTTLADQPSGIQVLAPPDEEAASTVHEQGDACLGDQGVNTQEAQQHSLVSSQRSVSGELSSSVVAGLSHPDEEQPSPENSTARVPAVIAGKSKRPGTAGGKALGGKVAPKPRTVEAGDQQGNDGSESPTVGPFPAGSGSTTTSAPPASTPVAAGKVPAQSSLKRPGTAAVGATQKPGPQPRPATGGPRTAAKLPGDPSAASSSLVSGDPEVSATTDGAESNHSESTQPPSATTGPTDLSHLKGGQSRTMLSGSAGQTRTAASPNQGGGTRAQRAAQAREPRHIVFAGVSPDASGLPSLAASEAETAEAEGNLAKLRTQRRMQTLQHQQQHAQRQIRQEQAQAPPDLPFSVSGVLGGHNAKGSAVGRGGVAVGRTTSPVSQEITLKQLENVQRAKMGRVSPTKLDVNTAGSQGANRGTSEEKKKIKSPQSRDRTPPSQAPASKVEDGLELTFVESTGILKKDSGLTRKELIRIQEKMPLMPSGSNYASPQSGFQWKSRAERNAEGTLERHGSANRVLERTDTISKKNGHPTMVAHFRENAMYNGSQATGTTSGGGTTSPSSGGGYPYHASNLANK